MNLRHVRVGRRALLGAVLPLLVALAPSGPVVAQAPCEPIDVRAGAAWSGPLARSVHIAVDDMTLRAALSRVADAAGVRISYSLEASPLERRVCGALDGAVGDALVALLRDLPVEPVAAGADHIVLTPAQPRVAEANTPDPEPVVPLQPIVVHADAASEANRRRDLVVDVLDGSDLARSPQGELWPALNASVPGMWMWGGPGMGVGYASIRGASSFDASGPKVYIDGIQVANPLLLTRLTSDAIERIEVIRGPQGAALYGADAISGVLDITTRAAPVASGPQFAVRSTFGLSATAFSAGTAIAHDHAFSVSLGSATRSATLDAALGTAGEPLAGSWSRHFDAGGSVRLVGERSLVSGTFRFQSQRAATAVSPILAGSVENGAGVHAALAPASTDGLSLHHFTTGLRAALTPEGAWTHSFVVGLDGYSLEGSDLAGVDVLGTGAVGTSALRGTLRAMSSASFQPAQALRGAFTVSLEHTVLHRSGVDEAAPPGADDGTQPFVLGARPLDSSHNDTGAGAQVDLSVGSRWFFTGGMRFEYTDGIAGIGGIATLPSIGASWTAIDGPVHVKLRSAWGKGIRWPELSTGITEVGASPIVYVPLDLGPEQQTGIEAGMDVDVGDAVSLRLTRFDQTASGLVQRIVLAERAGPQQRPAWAYQNVGEITNRGWEVQATTARGPLTIVGSFATVDSRVQRLAYGYAGDLRPGDRMLAVPARTYGATGTWAGRGWSASVGLTRATDWINYDRIALAEAMLGGISVDRDDLRDFWRRYDGVSHLGAYLSRDIESGVTLVLAGENLLNNLVGEPDNGTILRGRTVSLGVRATF